MAWSRGRAFRAILYCTLISALCSITAKAEERRVEIEVLRFDAATKKLQCAYQVNGERVERTLDVALTAAGIKLLNSGAHVVIVYDSVRKQVTRVEGGNRSVAAVAAKATEEPPEGAVEDLRKLMSRAGFDKKLALDSLLENYIRFGSQKLMEKHLKGDQFDRLELKNAVELHRADVRKKRFMIGGLTFVVDAGDDVEVRGLQVMVNLPMRVRGEKPFYEDAESFSGCVSMMHPAELKGDEYWFLRKDQTIRRCTPAEAEFVQRNDGVLYHPEVANTLLILTLKDKLDLLKHISRNSQDYSVEIEFTELTWERPLSWGYFERVAYFSVDRDCQKLRNDFLQDQENKQPVYFVTAFGEKDEVEIPEIVRANLMSLRMINKAGKVIGGYRIPKS